MAKKSNTTSSSASESDILTKEINAYLKTNTSIEAESIAEHDFFTDYLDSGNYALNWAISGKLNGGFPMTKTMEMFGDPGSGKSLMLVNPNGSLSK